jgi:hypothetical protein
MSMSKDRVVFKVPVNRLDNPELVKVLGIALGIGKQEVELARRAGRDLRVMSRPSQFGRFVVLRNRYGLDNLIKELDPFLVEAKEPFLPVDVPGRLRTPLSCVDASQRPSHVSPLHDMDRAPWPFDEPPF